ncbi:MAG: SIS domain-containing protein [Bdellovibrionales bacterium]|nr:SIS domain-containing protein [Bdellovibrionales bacterium]
MTHLDSYDDFLKVSELYKLGFLPTEMQHPLTLQLSDKANNSLFDAANMFYELDKNAINASLKHTDNIKELRKTVQKVLASKGKIFICGCGATGRLALKIESFFRQIFPEHSEQIVGFMAGGDIALVHSLEGYEDHPEYGENHLKQLNFTKNDLMLGVTEGGETPYVLGATKAAAQISHHKVFMLCCNPREILINNIERSRHVIEDPNVTSVHIDTGPMALSGSTRLQATTALMSFLGLSLLSENLEEDIKLIQEQIQLNHYLAILPMIEFESEVYRMQKYVHYNVTKNLALTAFTDTTERAPTFSTPSFEPTTMLTSSPSWCYISLIESLDEKQAWLQLLGRSPYSLNWPGDHKTTSNYMSEFDFSVISKLKRVRRLGDLRYIDVIDGSRDISFNFNNQLIDIPVCNNLWIKNLLLKLLLNFHSTVVMCRLGRVESNMMTWVRPSNGKLIDRATRYLLALTNNSVSYEEALKIILEQKNYLKPDESIIFKAKEIALKKSFIPIAT